MTEGYTGAIPTLGYPSRWEAAAALRAEGLTARQVAERIGTTKSAAYQLFAYAKRGRRKRPIQRIHVPGKVLVALADSAKQRGMKPADLARAILETVAADGLVSAVLDDSPSRQQIEGME